MNKAEPTLRIKVDPMNPGQFFACCGLLELADRLWAGAEGWFEKREYCILAQGDLKSLLVTIATTNLIQLDSANDFASPILLGPPFGLRLDWWLDDRSGGRELKVWAGSMRSVRIARAMLGALKNSAFHTPEVLNRGVVVYDPDKPDDKVEPFYFDARRGPNSHSRDVGFSPNDLQLITTAFPAVEFLCLVGLQRCLPARTPVPRVFDYYTWRIPLPAELLPPAVCGLLPDPGAIGFRFENWFRTGQRKHKAFLPARAIRGD
jgi:CRISPR-associated protein Csb3